MPSASLLHWQSNRLSRLIEIDARMFVSMTGVPPNATLVDENLRGYVLLLSAHFQGFAGTFTLKLRDHCLKGPC